MGGLGLDDEDLDDDDLEAMLSQMPPGMFEQMLREDAGKGGAAGEEAEGMPRMPPRAGGRKSASAGRTSGGPKPGGSSSRGGETASHTTPFAW